jgi:dTMP kinase
MVAIEGVDGAGKRTLTDALCRALVGRGAVVGGFAFPRYDTDVHAELVRDALYGRLGDLIDSVHGMALLYALDRRDAAAELRAALRSNDIVLVDRYVASNAAYGAARLRQEADGDFVAWIRALEIERFRIPAPDHHLLLTVPDAVADERVAHRERTEAGRERDAFEADAGLQTRTSEVYGQLALASWLSPWTVVDGTAPVGSDELAAQLLG